MRSPPKSQDIIRIVAGNSRDPNQSIARTYLCVIVSSSGAALTSIATLEAAMPKNLAISIFGSNRLGWKGTIAPFNATGFIADIIQPADDLFKSNDLLSPGTMFCLSLGGDI
jgi:hypothetical protein